MTTIKKSAHSSLRILALSALLLGTAATLASQLKFEGATVHAGCTVAGKATYLPDGTPACDCTSSQNPGTCTCIVKCEGGGNEQAFMLSQ